MGYNDSVCTRCGYVGQTKTVTPGSIFIELVLWCFLLVPGLVYSLWRMTSRRKVCASCGEGTTIPAGSPRGQAILQEREQASSRPSVVSSDAREPESSITTHT
jgi:hypothetical protein